jgi:hypothetical protein
MAPAAAMPYAFADAVEGAGGSFDADAHSEAILVHGQFLARDRELLLGLLADALQRPRFEPGELDKLRARRIEFIKAAKDSEPQSLIGSYGRALLFAGHTLWQAGRAAVRPVAGDHHQRAGAEVLSGSIRRRPPDAGVCRRFRSGAALKVAATAFSGWRRAGVAEPPLGPPERVRGRRVS